MNTVVLKYNAGNIQSVLFALERIGIQAIVTDDPLLIRSADKVIIPGVGRADSAMAYLRERELDKLIISLKQPVLGICLGMQLMCNYSEEGDATCLEIFDTDVKLFLTGNGNALSTNHMKVPQIGWNSITHKESGIFKEIPQNSYVYFVHSYYAGISDDTVAAANYIQNYSAALQKNNFYGTQFHPEKSAEAGQLILENFIKL